MQNCIALSNNSAGAQTVGVGKRTFIIPKGTWRLRDMQSRLGTAPTGANFVLDVNKNGTTIFTDQTNRPFIATGTFPANAFRPQSVSFVGGDRLSYDVDVIGSSVAGSDLDTTFFLELN